MKPRKILYKYRSINNFTKNLITKGELYFSKFSEQNDPNEATFDYSEDIDIFIEHNELSLYPNFIEQENSPDGRIRLRVSGRNAALHVKRRIDFMYGILCLTSDPKNLLMFDYYGGGHKGICIGIEWEKLGLIHKKTNIPQTPLKVQYSNIPPLIDFSGSSFDTVLFTKWKKYQHEKEFRLIYKPGIYPSSNNVLTSIKEIIFGVAITEKDRDLIKSWVNLNSLDVNFYQSKLKSNSYQLEIIKE